MRATILVILSLLLALTSRAQFSDTPSTTPPPDEPGLLERTELAESMCFMWPEASLSLKMGPEDGVYYSLTQAEIDDCISFWRARKEFFPYIEEAWDCDDFAREFLYLSRVWSVRHTRGAPVAPAIGAAFILADGYYELFRSRPFIWPTMAHVINVILRDDGQWFFFEPQSGTLFPIEGPIYEGSVRLIKIQI